MSRVGSSPVAVPDGIDIQITGQLVSAKGKLGELAVELPSDVEVTQDGGKIVVKPRSTSKRARMAWGTSRALVNNLVLGVSDGFSKTLEITGVGYRAAVQGKTLNLQLGFSHDVNFPIPEGISINCEGQTTIVISGADKQAVGQVAAVIRSYRKPEPYKGKGIKYAGEVIIRKEGKKK
ncbi:MAG: 50S ribosomal protein L6 [Rhodospirillaceae bacterium]|jgi:large subunit ribosomal protein L6|nr:50S ribosomal protein L6 [Rhodospirillaceae bacterium]MBT3930903.1 50S ribosomal protein L6 [Rhodospirillaceae bacterium]MBT4771870.1 50S ribosomal protein L6 [Rhodospirillaceae bacterium]MBT5358852.1 50S ribosomal protein L6 [Rhodospirillaceae bacterium]MBT5767893.1 50S ribosomal protein L6 [Rhodospirillaceae bacterium]